MCERLVKEVKTPSDDYLLYWDDVTYSVQSADNLLCSVALLLACCDSSHADEYE